MFLYSPASALIQVMSSSDSQKSHINTSTNNSFEIGGVVYITSTTPAPQGCAQYMTFDVATPPAHPSTNAARVRVIRSTEDYNVTAVESSHPNTKRKNNSQENVKSKFQKTCDESSESDERDETELTHQFSAKTAESQPYLTVPCDANEGRDDGINRSWMAYNEQHCEISPDTPKASRLDYPRKFYVSGCNDHTAVSSMQNPPILKNQSRLISRLQPESKKFNGSEQAKLTSCDGSSTNYRLLSNVTIMKCRQGNNIAQELKIKALIQQEQYDFSVTVTAISNSRFIAIQCILNAMIAHDNEYITTKDIGEWIKQNQPDLYLTKKQPHSWANELNLAISENQKIFETPSISSKSRKYRLKTAIITGEFEPEDSNSASSTDCQPSSNVTIESHRQGTNNTQTLKINVQTKQKLYDFSVTVKATSDSSYIAIQCLLNAMIANDNKYLTIAEIKEWIKESKSDIYSRQRPATWTQDLRNAISENKEIIGTMPSSCKRIRYRLNNAILTGEVEA